MEILESESEEWSIRANAAEALGKIGDVAALPSLIRALSYDEENVRREAARALRQIGSSAISAVDAISWDRRSPAVFRVFVAHPHCSAFLASWHAVIVIYHVLREASTAEKPKTIRAVFTARMVFGTQSPV